MYRAKFFYIIKSKINPCLWTAIKKNIEWQLSDYILWKYVCLSHFLQDLLHWLETQIFVLSACLSIFLPLVYYFSCFPIKSASNKCQKRLLQKQSKNMPPIKSMREKHIVCTGLAAEKKSKTRICVCSWNKYKKNPRSFSQSVLSFWGVRFVRKNP